SVISLYLPAVIPLVKNFFHAHTYASCFEQSLEAIALEHIFCVANDGAVVFPYNGEASFEHVHRSQGSELLLILPQPVFRKTDEASHARNHVRAMADEHEFVALQFFLITRKRGERIESVQKMLGLVEPLFNCGVQMPVEIIPLLQ